MTETERGCIALMFLGVALVLLAGSNDLVQVIGWLSFGIGGVAWIIDLKKG